MKITYSFQHFILPTCIFCHFVSRKAVGLTRKCFLFAADSSQVSIFFLHKIKMGNSSIDLTPKLSLTCRGNVNHYKSVHHLFCTLPAGIGTILQHCKFSKFFNKLFFKISAQVYSLLEQTEGEMETFSEGSGSVAHCEVIRLLFIRLSCKQVQQNMEC